MPQKTALFTFGDADEDVSRMRHFVARWLEQSEVREPARSDLVFAVGEAVANACRHACPPGHWIDVACVRRGRRVAVSVRDEGRGFTPDRNGFDSEPDLLATRGRGLFLMRQLTDRLEIAPTPSGTRVVLVKDVRPD